ncbi:HNH endonuclease family protein [Brachyspira sp.]|uniref:HNH endonuclease family protein n=1 Tax=Brachyspira sp. TaxID=1977261 RepID=UPI00345BBF47
MHIAKFLVKWHWLHLVNGYTIEKIKSFNFSILRVIKTNNNSINEIIKLNPRVITHDGKTLEILSKGVCNTLRISNFYNLKWGRALLYFLFNKPLLETLENTIDITFTPLKSTIEHIYPQNPKEDEWINCSEDFKHKLGNLTLLDKRSNIQASNDTDKKIKIYNNKLFMYTPELSENDPWTDEKIASRTDELLKDFCKYIDINYYD